MDKQYLTNIARLRAVAQALSALKQKVVLVGGATVALYTNPELAQEVRPTDDVDVIVELATYGNYAVLEETLRKIGFVNDSESRVVCRYKIKGITVDIMPTDPQVIGFSNRWYPEGFARSTSYDLGTGLIIEIFALPYLIASKLEAFSGRGKMDFLFSTDFEDIVYLFENAVGLENSLLSSTGELRTYLNESLQTLSGQPDFEEGLYAHLHPTHASFQAQRILSLIQRITGTDNN